MLQKRDHGPPAVEAELLRLRASLDQRDALIAELRAADAVKQGLLDRIEAEAPGRALERLRDEVALWKARYEALLAAAESPTMSFRDRAITAVALSVPGVVRSPLDNGPAPPPVQVRISEIEQRAGVSRGSTASALKKATALGFLTRTEGYGDRKRPDGSAEPRLHVYLAPGSGRVDPAELERQRAEEEARRARAKAAKDARDAAERAMLALRLEAVERAAESGCLCGGDLVPTGYICAEPWCVTRYTPAEVLALPPHVRRERKWDKALPRLEPGPVNAAKTRHRSSKNICRENPALAPPGPVYGLTGDQPF